MSKGKASPFFFVIGAGISLPQVPLASDIIRECKSRTNGVQGPTSGSAVLDEYSYWLDAAFNSPAERQDYFQSLIKAKPIPLANFRLAHLLLGNRGKKPLASLVITTNFDDFLTRALQLFGKEHVLCDSPATTPRLDLSNTDLLQIIHVHGTYHFYDIKNLSGEVKATAAFSEETTATMASLLDWVLRDHSPIVVGYGGWEGDVFMRALYRRLGGGSLPCSLYWCCYQRNDWQSLPDWLKKNSSVRFVVPEEPTAVGGSAPERGTSASASAGATASVLETGGKSDPKLDAQFVFDELIKALEVDLPELTQNPIKFFADQLDRSLLQDSAMQSRDMYGIKSTVDEMREAAKWIIENREHRTATQKQLDAVREALRGAKYGEAMSLTMDVRLDQMNDREKAELWDMAWEIISSAAFSEHASDETLAMLDRFEQMAAVVPVGSETSKRVGMSLSYRILHLFFLGRTDKATDALIDFVQRARQSSDPAIHVSAVEFLIQLGRICFQSDPGASAHYFQVVLSMIGEWKDEPLGDYSGQAMFGLGLAFLGSGQKVEAVDQWRMLLSRIDAGTTTLPEEASAQMLVAMGLTLAELNGPSDDALAAFDEVVKRFGEMTEPGVREQVAAALRNKGVMLSERNQTEKALEAYDELVRRFDDATEPGVREHVAAALRNKGVVFGEHNQTEKALESYNELVRRFGDATEPAVREHVAAALRNKGVMLAERDQNEKALEAYDELIRRFGNATEPGVREHVAAALRNKAVRLANQKQTEKALETYNELFRRFGDATEPGVREQVAAALRNKGAFLGEHKQTEKALEAYDELIRRFGDATEPGVREHVAAALRNKGVMLGENNQTEKALEAYDELVRRFGDATEPDVREHVAAALRNKAVRLASQEQTEKALGTYDELVKHFGDAVEPGVRAHVAAAFCNKALLLAEHNQTNKALETYDELVRRFGDATESAVRELVAAALRNKALRLAIQGQTEKALETYDELVRRFGDATEPSVREPVAGALCDKGVMLAERNQTEKALEAYDELIRRFGDGTEPGVREQVATALCNKGVILGKHNQGEKALQTYDEVLRRFGDGTEPGVREQVAAALCNQGLMLDEQKQTEKALQTYDELVRRFGDATEPGVREQVGNALNAVAFKLLCEAKSIWKEKGRDEALKTLTRAKEHVERALLYRPSQPVLLGNKGYILFLMGETEAGAATLCEAIKLGGEDVRQGELADSNIHSLPEDDAFRTLVRTIPGQKEGA
jgi:tetratricopeptide (TPR) repeat protein